VTRDAALALACAVCGQTLDEFGQCDVCTVALRDGVTIEEIRSEIEDLARSMTARFASAEGKPCTCGAGPSCVAIQEGPRRGRRARPAGCISFDIHHAHGCPRAPAPFEWPPVDEAERARVFGYGGQTMHMRRLASVLRAHLDDRLWEET
jgi:hypothetical protein